MKVNIRPSEIQVKKLYAYYDQPVLFLGEQDGQLYLVVYADKTETDNIFLYAPVSLNRVLDIESGKFDLHTAFREAENGFVYKVFVALYRPQSRTEMVACQDLKPEELPLAGAYLLDN